MRRSQAPSQRGKKPPAVPIIRALPQHQHDTQQTGQRRRFQVLYGRISTKTTQKTFERDGWLELSNNNLNLYDEEGEEVCSELYVHLYMKLREGAEMIVGNKEVKIVRELQSPGNDASRRPADQSTDTGYSEFADYVPPRQVAPVVVKEEPPDDRKEHDRVTDQFPVPIKTEPVETVPPPVTTPRTAREELVLFCEVSFRQKIIFNEIYQDLETVQNNDDAMEKLSDLQECCCNITSGKIPVIRHIINRCLEQRETVLILADTEKILEDLYCFVQEFKRPCYQLSQDSDVQELSELPTTEASILIGSVGYLAELHRHHIPVHRTIINESVHMDDELTDILFELTQKSVYELIISGSMEERLFQMKHGLVQNDEQGLQLLKSPLPYDQPNTHAEINCDCLQDEGADDHLTVMQRWEKKRQRLETCDLRDNWEHLTGKALVARDGDHLQGLPPSHIVFAFRRMH